MSDIVDAAKTGDQLTLLIALRAKLAETLQNSKSGRDIAALSKQLREVAEQIKALEEENSQSDTIFNILSSRRAAGLPGAIRDENRKNVTYDVAYDEEFDDSIFD